MDITSSKCDITGGEITGDAWVFFRQDILSVRYNETYLNGRNRSIKGFILKNQTRAIKIQTYKSHNYAGHEASIKDTSHDRYKHVFGFNLSKSDSWYNYIIENLNDIVVVVEHSEKKPIEKTTPLGSYQTSDTTSTFKVYGLQRGLFRQEQSQYSNQDKNMIKLVYSSLDGMEEQGLPVVFKMSDYYVEQWYGNGAVNQIRKNLDLYTTGFYTVYFDNQIGSINSETINGYNISGNIGNYVIYDVSPTNTFNPYQPKVEPYLLFDMEFPMSVFPTNSDTPVSDCIIGEMLCNDMSSAYMISVADVTTYDDIVDGGLNISVGVCKSYDFSTLDTKYFDFNIGNYKDPHSETIENTDFLLVGEKIRIKVIYIYKGLGSNIVRTELYVDDRLYKSKEELMTIDPNLDGAHNLYQWYFSFGKPSQGRNVSYSRAEFNTTNTNNTLTSCKFGADYFHIANMYKAN